MIKKFEYNHFDITFNLDNDVLINATEMAKAFPKKRMNDFITNKQTVAFSKILESKTGIPVLVVKHGGSDNGTWMHQKLAIKFAAWLNPTFELWVFDRIEELLITGKTEIQQLPAPKSQAEILLMYAQMNVENERRLTVLEQKVEEVTAKQLSSPQDYFAVAGFASIIKKPINVQIAAAIGSKAKAMCKKLGYECFPIPDPRFGKVLTYPKDVLQAVFNEYFKKPEPTI